MSTAAARERPREAIYTLDIPQKSRRQALVDLSNQVDGMRLVYTASSTEEEQARVGPVQGNFTVAGALSIILRDSDLTYRINKQNKLVVERKHPQQHSDLPEEQAVEKSANAGLPQAPGQTAPVAEHVYVYSEPWRSITRSMAPVTVLDRDKLDDIGALTVAEALRYISQNAFVRAEGYHTSGAQYAQMRGLGSDTALILINGRRAMPSAGSLISGAFDLNTIPMAAVESMELILDSPAIANGTDAIGGVINIKLYRQVTEPTIKVEHGAAAGGAEHRHGSVSFGTAGDKFNAAVTVDYLDVNGLLGAERDRWNNQDHRRWGGKDERSLISSAGNVTAADSYNLPGLAFPNAAVPLVDSTAGISRDDFVATAGSSNLDSLLKYSSVVPEARRIGLAANASYNFNDSVLVSADLLYSDRNSTFFFCPPALFGALVARSNAYNPFGAPVRVFRLIPELGTQYQYVESELLRAAIQLEGSWADWKWSLSALHSRERSSTWFHNELDLTAEGSVMQALASPDPARALNPFQSGPLGSEELLRSLILPPRVDHFVSAGKQVMGYAEGPLFPRVTALVGAEWRQESALFASHNMGRFDGKRDVSSAFAELRVTLVGETTPLPAIHSLSLVAGSRVDHYEGMDSVVRSQFGLHWKPVRSVKVRVSEARSFRPPSLYELYLPKTTAHITVPDPARGNEPTDIGVIAGGNDSLKPTTANTLTAGLVFSPDASAKWKMSVDYWRVTMDDRVSTLSPLMLLANEASFPDRITRAGRVGGDLAPLQTVDSSLINAGRVKISGVDIVASADFPIPHGDFKPELRATWFDSFVASDLPGQPAVERVNLASDAGSILEWRAILLLPWSQGPYGITTVVRYSPAYDDAIAGVRTGREVASQTLIDLHGSLELGQLFDKDSALSGLKLSVGAFNLFNVAPSVSEVSGGAGADLSQANLKQRSYYLRVEKKF